MAKRPTINIFWLTYCDSLYLKNRNLKSHLFLLKFIEFYSISKCIGYGYYGSVFWRKCVLTSSDEFVRTNKRLYFNDRTQNMHVVVRTIWAIKQIWFYSATSAFFGCFLELNLDWFDYFTMDRDKLISLVYDNRCLWDMRNKRCRNRDISRQKWEEVATELNITSKYNCLFCCRIRIIVYIFLSIINISCIGKDDYVRLYWNGISPAGLTK